MATNNNTQLAGLIREFGDCQDREAAEKKFDDNREYLVSELNAMCKRDLMRMYKESIKVDKIRTLNGLYYVLRIMLNVDDAHDKHLYTSNRKVHAVWDFYWVYVIMPLSEAGLTYYNFNN